MPDDQPNNHDAFSMKEAVIALSNRLKSVDEKQDRQLVNQYEVKMAVSVLPDMRTQINELSGLVKDPEKGVICRLVRVENTLGLQGEAALRREDNSFSARTQIIAAIVGAIVIAAATALMGYLHWAH